MNKWFISDTHFSHANIIRYTGRPFQSVDEMNQKLIENWNAHIEPQDIVFFLGDFGLWTTDFLFNLCSQLYGQKICIRGNHDGTPAKMHKIGFSLVLESVFIKIGRHERTCLCGYCKSWYQCFLCVLPCKPGWFSKNHFGTSSMSKKIGLRAIIAAIDIKT